MSGEQYNDLGKALRALRIASDKTAETVARRASMSPAKLSKIENGRTLPSVQDVDLILSALGISDEAKPSSWTQLAARPPNRLPGGNSAAWATGSINRRSRPSKPGRLFSNCSRGS
ncbi:helix-turn-helix transcriptional regulator [Streptomyces rubellomurinus]|uniref:helix-turn-helix domain-containing protein n=1 Tax=Streptomyces rubellomurinus (strain ATCC 31215) TaxID=359131 RepID=UPI003133C91A